MVSGLAREGRGNDLKLIAITIKLLKLLSNHLYIKEQLEQWRETCFSSAVYSSHS